MLNETKLKEKPKSKLNAEDGSPEDEFISFDQVPENAYISQDVTSLQKKTKYEEESSDEDTRIAKKFD